MNRKTFFISLLFAIAPSLAFASFVPGQTLDPQCLPSDSTCIVIGIASNVAGSFTATSTNATSTFSGGFSIGGSQFVVQQATGRIGIGTTSPFGLVDVVGSSNSTTLNLFDANRALSLINTDTTNNNASGFDFRTNDTAGLLTTGSKIMGVYTSHAAGAVSGDIAFLTRNAGTLSEKFRILANGNVGIGTTSPAYLLDVNGTGHFNSLVDAANFVATSSSATSTFAGGLNVANGGLIYDRSTGFVGIGTSTPQTPLNVQANSSGLGLRVTRAGAATVDIESSPGTGWVGTVSNDALSFFTNNGAQQMYLATSGNIAIGNTLPTYKLDVTGTGHFTSLLDAANFVATSSSATSTFAGGLSVLGNLNMGIASQMFQNGQTFMTSLPATSDLFIGYQANPLPGFASTVIGYQAMASSTGGFANSAVGYQVLKANTTGAYNVAFGRAAMSLNTTGGQNVSIGTFSLSNNTTGSRNTSSGYLSMSSNTTGALNTAYGAFSLTGITTGNLNIDVGYNNGNPTTGSNNITIGNQLNIASSTLNGQLNIGNILFGTGVIGSGATIAGNIGIGTTTPWGLLSVSALANSSTPQFVVASSTAVSLYVGNNGFVGIGTSSPLAMLDITGNNTSAVTGSELITAVGDRTFASNTGNWTGTGWTISGNVDTHVAGNNALTLSNTALSSAPVAGSYYQVSYDINTTATGTPGVTIAFGGAVAGSSYGVNADGNQTGQVAILLATNANPLTITPNNATWTGTITNVSIKQITPSSGVQTIRNSDGSVGLETRAGGSGLFSIGIGQDAGLVNQAPFNVFMGYQAGRSNVGGIRDTFIGTQAGYANVNGIYSTYIGNGAGASNVNGSYNAMVGVSAGQFNVTGGGDVLMGYRAGYANTSGSSNSAFGHQSGYNNTSGSANSSFGSGAGSANYTGSNNTYIGASAGASASLITGSNNVFLGYQSGVNLSSGSNNLILSTATSSTAVSNITTGSQNILIGNNISLPSATANGQLNIGNIIYGTGVTGTVSTVSSANIGIGTSSPTAQLHTTGTVRFSNFGSGTLTTDASGNLSVSSDERLKNIDGSFTRGLSDIMKLSPISYHWNQISGLDMTNSYSGFSAQNVQSAIPEAIGTTSNGFLTLQDRPLIAAAVNAIKSIATISDDFKTNMIAWLGNASNGLTRIFAGEVDTQKLCVGSTCLTESQLQQLIQAQNGVGGSPALPTLLPVDPTPANNSSSTPEVVIPVDPTPAPQS
jgi:hypothetical protein